MRVAAVLAVVLLLSGCTWVHRELAPVLPPAPIAAPAAKPAEKPHKPIPPPPHAERPAPPAQSVTSTPSPPPPVDYSARCHAMADNRANDAKGLGATGSDLAKVQQDTYRDCMAQSVGH
jgi:hypothetical protein